MLETLQHLEGQHSWFACSHSRPTYCNVCHEMLHGVAWHGLSCEVCKFKSHRRCVFQVRATLWHDLSCDCHVTVMWPQFLSLMGQHYVGHVTAVCHVHRSHGTTLGMQEFGGVLHFSHYYSCDSHMVCLPQVKKPCKWTTRNSLRKDGVGLQADVSDIDKTLGTLD